MPTITNSEEIRAHLAKRPPRAPAKTPRPCCLACGKKLRRASRWVEQRTGLEWGDYGDNIFCGLRCGYDYAIAVTRKKP